jgi:acetyl-CoA/propionyl-CoA carboxylase, biotin carboxylase, biotin carboxyl carrier protein
MFRRILIANRGEIAVRVIHACRELGISPVAVFSDADRDALHVQMADAAVHLGPPPARESYLAIDKVIEAAKSTGAEAIHPGYGFLSENPAFARACADAGIVFIGPSPETLEATGDKVEARRSAAGAGAPIVPGLESIAAGSDEARRATDTLGLPLLVKAAGGGGGKGMRVVRKAEELPAALAAAEREALAAFGNGRVFLERYVERPRHVEVQILADAHGNVLHLGERECSLQRRHQKIVEEAPSAVVDEALRERLTTAAVKAARAVNYVNAGTVEFLLGADGEFYFLEINPRLQVEHPVTEMVTGIDLVIEQIRVALGEKLRFRQEDVRLRGHAIECRLYGEDPANRFLPSSGPVRTLELPSGPGVRIDSALFAGGTIAIEYDPLVAKIIAWAPDRELARRRMISVLDRLLLIGPANNLAFLRALMEMPEFARAEIDTQLIERRSEGWDLEPRHADDARVLAAVVAASGGASEAAAGGPAAPPSPWETLGGWRVGSGAST